MFYIEKDGEIIVADEDKSKVVNTRDFLPDGDELLILETDKEIVNCNGKYYFADDAELRRQEKLRIQTLSMTRSDFFDNTIKAWGASSEDLLPVVKGILETLGISDIEKKIAINNYENALNFYRKHTLFTLLSGIPIPIGSMTVIVSEGQWDRFFDKVDKRDPNAYKELLPDLES